MWVTRETRNRSINGPLAWMGTLIDGMRDNSGQMYMRNRYYDPASGRFTQEDPIGLAGGLNAYGFAGGDPVSYNDPYGLCKTLADGTDDPSCKERLQTLLNRTAEYSRRVNQWNAAMRDGWLEGRDHTAQEHMKTNIQNDRTALRRALDRLERLCGNDNDDDDFRGGVSAATAALALPLMQGPARYPDKDHIPPRSVSAEQVQSAGFWAVAATVTYWIVSEGSRIVFPPRNLIPLS